MLTGTSKNRFLGCEVETLSQEEGAPLLLCAITDGIAVGFPSGDWNRHWLTVRFTEMPDDGDGSTVEDVQNY